LAFLCTVCLFSQLYYLVTLTQVKHDANFLFQIHSLTARSVPRQFREDLRKGLPDTCDRNIKVTTRTTTNISPNTTSGHSEAQNSDNNTTTSDECYIIYDSQKKDCVPYPNADVIRTPSPEHVGIPAGPVKMPPIRSWQSSTSSGNAVSVGKNLNNGYTSDDSNASVELVRRPHPPNRRKLLAKQASNPSVKSLVAKFAN
jgi:hypothetical protein